MVVTQSKPEAVSNSPLEVPTLCDPERTAYRYFGLERGYWPMFFRWRVLARYLRLMFSGWWPQSWEAGEDLLQLGGDFVISSDRHLLFAHRSTDPADRPPVSDLLSAIRKQ
jgi:hypothetical protein